MHHIKRPWECRRTMGATLLTVMLGTIAAVIGTDSALASIAYPLAALWAGNGISSSWERLKNKEGKI